MTKFEEGNIFNLVCEGGVIHITKKWLLLGEKKTIVGALLIN